MTKVYIITNTQRAWISDAMRKAGFTVVDRIELAEFHIKYREEREYKSGGWGEDYEQKAGYLEVTALPQSEDAELPRNIFSTRKTKYWYVDEPPHKAAIKSFLEELAKVK